jgi:dGTPase
MDSDCFNALIKAKKDNYQYIYNNSLKEDCDMVIKQMMGEIYQKLLTDLKNKNQNSLIYTHHISYVNKPYYKRDEPYENTEPNQLVVDYIASMTDDYFVELHKHLFPSSTLELKYKGYFE